MPNSSTSDNTDYVNELIEYACFEAEHTASQAQYSYFEPLQTVPTVSCCWSLSVVHASIFYGQVALSLENLL